MPYEMKITGSGSSKELISDLNAIIEFLEGGSHIADVQDRGECEYELPSLMTVITEED